MRLRTKRVSAMVAGAVAAGLGAKTAHAQYTVVTDVSVPFYSGDGVSGSTTASASNSSSAFVNYTTLSVNGSQTSFPISSVPNGNVDFPLTGTVTGTVVGGSVSDTTGWAYDPTYGFRLIGSYSESSTGAHSGPTIKGANSLGIIGTTPRSSSSNASTGLLGGSDAWFYNNSNSTNTLLGLMGTGASTPFGYSYQSSAGVVYGTVQTNTPLYLNLSGQVVGTTSRYAGVSAPTSYASESLGTSAWVQQVGGTAKEIGLTGNGYNYYASGTLTGFNSAGGYTTAAPYSGNYYSQAVAGQDSAGDVIGTASANYNTGFGGSAAFSQTTYNSTGLGAYQALGQDGWIYNGSAGAAATTTAIGLFQSNISNSNMTAAIPGYPSVFGYGYELNSNNSTGLVGYNASNGTEDVAPNALNTIRYTSLLGVSKSGQVIGDSMYYNTSSSTIPSPSSGFGQDAFVYSPATGGYTQVGLLTNNFNSGGGNHQTANLTSFVNGFGARVSTPVAINDNNTVIGTSVLYIGAGLSANYTNGGAGYANAAWVANATTGATTQIGLFNQNTGVHVEPSNGSAPGGYVDTPLFLTESGYVAGQTARWNSSNGNSLGLDGWLYDPNKNMTFPVDPAQEASNGYVSTSIEYLSESGVVVGEVKNSSGGAYQAFIYSESGGFALLGNDVTNGLSSSGYNALIEAYYADPSGTIYSTAATSGTTVNAVVSLVPEPTSLSVLALGGVGLLGRRRRLSNRS